jgi:uncharacterized glyoxalase superfamily protein PhnB
MRLHTYLNYGGKCEQAFRLYEKHLGGKVTMMMAQGEQRDLHADAGDVPHFPVRDAARQVWNVMDDHQRTNSSAERLANVFSVRFAVDNGMFPV